MDYDTFRLVAGDLAESLAGPASLGAASGGLVWLFVFVAAALVLGIAALVIVRKRSAARGRPATALTLFVVAMLVLGAGVGAWAGFVFGATRGASAAIEEALGKLGEAEIARVLAAAEPLAAAVGVPLDALDLAKVERMVEPYVAALAKREAAANLIERAPLVLERAALEGALAYARDKLGETFTWDTLRARAGALALERLGALTHSALAPVRHAGMPVAIGWIAFVLALHAFAIARASRRAG